MTRIVYLLFAMTMLLTASCQRSNAMRSDPTVEQLSATRARLKQAMLEGDIETIKRVYSDNYGLITRRGVLLTRPERIEMLESGRLKYLDVGVETQVVLRVYGSTAVVTGVVGVAITEFDGERRESSARRFTEFWIYESGEWREVIRQTTVIEG